MSTSLITSHGSLGSEGFQDHPVLISNNELFSMMKMLKQQLSQQHKNNKTLLKEMERMKAEIYKPHEASPLILQHDTLNFDSA